MRVSDVLQQLGLHFEVFNYLERDATAQEAAASLGVELGQIIKTLVVKGRDQGFAVVLTPGNVQIDWKKLADVLHDRKVRLASASEVTKITGYVVGSVSPLGMSQQLPIYIDEGAFEHERVGINGGERGVEILLDPQDLQRATGAKSVRIADDG